MLALANNTVWCDSLWDIDDFSVCGRQLFLELWLVLPLGISILLVASNFLFVRTGTDNYDASSKLDAEQQPLLGSHLRKYSSVKEDTDISPLKRHFDISLIQPVEQDGTIKFVFRGFGEKLSVALEFLLLLVQTGFTIVALPEVEPYTDSPYWFAKYVSPTLWVYLTLITVIRLYNVSQGLAPERIDLWTQSSILYNAQWFCSAMFFRSALLDHAPSALAANYFYTQFGINTALVFINGFQKFSDKPAPVYEKDGIPPSPETTSTLFNIVTYSWIDKMVFKAYAKPITLNEIWGLRLDDTSHVVLSKFHQLNSKTRFTIRLLLQFKEPLFLQSVYACGNAVMGIIPSIALKKVLEYIQSPRTSSTSMAWLWVIIIFASSALEAGLSGRCLFEGRRICIRLRSILVGEVYSKALRRRLAVKEKSAEKSDGEEESGDENKEDEPAVKDMGGIINLMAVDAFKVSEIAGYLHFFTSSTITSVLAVVLLYKLLGWSSLVGTVSLLALMPLTYRITTTLAGYQKKMLEVTDKRIQKINETFQNIRVIKYFGWEEKFADTIIGIRNEELRFLLLRCYAWTCSAFLWCVAPSIVSLVTFYFFTVWQGESLTTPIAFTSLSLFNLLRTPLDQLAEMMSFVIQSKVSLDRIEQFLDEPETEKYDQLTYPRGPDSPLVGFENATFYWSKNSKNEFALRDLNIDFKVGKLNVIVGPTGSGKTSLLLALLGEMDLDKGHVFLPGASAREELIPNPVTGLVESVAYCAQTAWLLNATIKENILFASPFNQERYDAVIYACGLARDLEILEAGDETEIGEKGITLSGGQKQRVSLARALYSSSSYLLLDDCLSAVDSHTAVHIYDNCINGELMKGRTCLLVSHNVALTIKEADHVVVLDNGRVKAQGSVDKLIEDGVLAEDTIKSVLVSRSVSTANLDELADKQDVKQTLKSAGQALVNASNADVKDPDKKQGKSKLVEEETKSDGAVKKEVYYAYFKHFGSIPFWIILIFSFGATQGVFVEQSYWLRLWAAREDEKVGVSMNAVSHAVGYITSGAAWQDSVAFFRNWSSSPYLTTSVLQPIASSAEEHGTMFYIAIYAAIGFLYAGFIVFRLLLCFYGGINVSKKMFGELLNKVLHARLRFFDQTPIGRIMNRFSKDIEGIDQELAPCADSFLDCLISCLTILVMICVVTPGFIFAALIIFALYVAVGALYLTLSRDLKRFESITKSPIHQHFSETLAGMTTIRAYGEERRFLRQNLDKIDANNRPFWYVWVNNRWLAYRADIIGAFISFFAAVFAVAFAYTLDAGLAGISLSFAVSFRQSALWLVRMYSYVEINMNSVERVQEYIEGTPQEPAKVLPQDPVNSWPSEGVIDVKNISIRYAPDLPRVIDDVSFHVNAGEKIGVVGRTGAGKSTIITSFFRFVDLDDGSITIDGLDISKIGLKALRQGLAIIPQDPTLFTGTIRSNLDMFQEYSDLEMFESLRRVNLISGLDFQRIVNCNGAPVEDEAAATEENANKFLDLDSAVTEGGANLSQGERQLLCLARSILKTPKILMLDEATASIDYESDAKIQTTIREEFLASTILTIAHRLKTIIDYDKILVLDHGKVKEFDHPYKLITDKKSDFRKMCQDTGEFDELVNLAKQAYKK